jgi:hypothetical protein
MAPLTQTFSVQRHTTVQNLMPTIDDTVYTAQIMMAAAFSYHIVSFLNAPRKS